MKNNILKILGIFGGIVFIFSISIFIFVFTTGKVTAETTPTSNNEIKYTLLEPLPCNGDKNCVNGVVTTYYTRNQKDAQSELGNYIALIFKLFIGIAVALAIVMISWGGFTYATTDAYNKKELGREYLWNAIIGLLMVLCSYLILYYIDPRFVKFNTSLDPIGGVLTQKFSFEAINKTTSFVVAEEAERLGRQQSNVTENRESLETTNSKIESLKDKLYYAENYGASPEEIQQISSELESARTEVARTRRDYSENVVKQDVLLKIQHEMSNGESILSSSRSAADSKILTGDEIKEIIDKNISTNQNSQNPLTIREIEQQRLYITKWAEIENIKASFIKQIDETNSSGVLISVDFAKYAITAKEDVFVAQINSIKDYVLANSEKFSNRYLAEIVSDTKSAIDTMKERSALVKSNLETGTPKN